MADKSKALESALQQIEKQYGKGAIMRLGQTDALNVEGHRRSSQGKDR